MKVKLLRLIACPIGVFKSGSETELPEDIAKGLIEENYAESLESDEYKDTKSEFPKHIVAGNFILSNGEKVKGKDAAILAEKALKGGDN